jgi:hypothetical protein
MSFTEDDGEATVPVSSQWRPSRIIHPFGASSR